MPAYFNGTLYYGARGWRCDEGFQDYQRQALSAGPILQTSNTFRYPGTTPSISANGTSNGMVWAVENTTPAVLHACAPAICMSFTTAIRLAAVISSEPATSSSLPRL